MPKGVQSPKFDHSNYLDTSNAQYQQVQQKKVVYHAPGTLNF
jgi:hypothetical protein